MFFWGLYVSAMCSRMCGDLSLLGCQRESRRWAVLFTCVGTLCWLVSDELRVRAELTAIRPAADGAMMIDSR